MRRIKLGQSFLKDRRAQERIASALDIQKSDVVIEIGPGHGELTRRILSYEPEKVFSIEIDPNLIEYYLKDLSEESPNLEVIEGDALIDLPKLSERVKGEYKLVGNIPYYLTGKLLRIISELNNKPSLIVFTVQKEVGERLCAVPPKMNLLAASIGCWGHPEIVRYISKKSFNPVPKVDSAIIKITPKDRGVPPEYYKFIKALFGQPRKTIMNNLRGLKDTKEEVEEVLLKVGIDPKLRPHNLSITDIEKLSSLFTHN